MTDDYVLGTVTQASPLLVKVDGATTASPSLRLASYTPVLNDRIVLAMFGARLLTLGKVL